MNTEKAIKLLGLFDTKRIRQRAEKALEIYENSGVKHINAGIFRVKSQKKEKWYEVDANRMTCTCKDSLRTINCKHHIACKLWIEFNNEGKKPKAIYVSKNDTENSYMKRGRWWIADHHNEAIYIVYRDRKGNFICPCGRQSGCQHKRAIQEYLEENKS